MTKKHLILLPSILHDSYVVKFKDGATEIGPTINITIEKATCTPTTLLWLNSRGGYDSYAFEYKRTEELQAARDISRRQLSNLTASQYSVSSIESGINGVLQSDYLDNDSMGLLSALIESPLVYLVHLDNGAYNYVPVNILTKSLPKRRRSLEKFEIEYELAFERINQNSLNVQPSIPAPSNDVEWENLWS
jgi:hypothetical protein